LRYFILTVRKLPRVDRQEIDRGTMNREAITVVSCVRSSLFTSYGVRRDVNVILYPLDPGDILIRIEGDKLRYMGPDERSISVLLSIPSKDLLCETVKKSKVTSPGITLVRENPAYITGSIENPLVIYQRSDGQDIRRIKISNKMVYFGSLDYEADLDESGVLPANSLKSPIGVTGTQCEKTVLLINSEIDRRLGKNMWNFQGKHNANTGGLYGDY
jgi:tRNA pseudouridine-54 N-methylase